MGIEHGRVQKLHAWAALDWNIGNWDGKSGLHVIGVRLEISKSKEGEGGCGDRAIYIPNCRCNPVLSRGEILCMT